MKHACNKAVTNATDSQKMTNSVRKSLPSAEVGSNLLNEKEMQHL